LCERHDWTDEGEHMWRARGRRAGMAVAVVAAVAGIAGCTVPKPPGAAPLRYRDAIFPSVSVTRDLTYGSAPGANGAPVALKLDLYQPTGDAQRQRPALIWVHGGGFTSGSKTSGAGKATTFAKLGYVSVSIDYRLLAPPGCAGDPTPAPA
jgi:acetyl esterase/lipase